MDDPLAEFRKFVEQVGWVGKASVAGPVAVPTVPFFVSLIANSPLWPESPTVLAGFATLGTYVLEMIIYIYSFQRWRSMSQERLTNRLKLSIVASAILACLFGLYLYFFIHPMAG